MNPVFFGALTEGQQASIRQQNLPFYSIGEHRTKCFGQTEDIIERRLEAEGREILKGGKLSEDSFSPSQRFRQLEEELTDAYDGLEQFAEKNDGGLNVTHRKYGQYVLENIRDCDSMFVSDRVIERLVAFIQKCDANDPY